MNVLSLFDGMSCGQIALNKLGIKIDNYFASEIKDHAIKITQEHFPKTIQLGDVTKLKFIDWNNPKIDLLIGGSPCQDFSRANKDIKGLDGEKSGLFWEYFRILNELKKVNPNVLFLLENVKMKPEHAKQITHLLGVEPILIDSALVTGAYRKRLYWTNIPGIEQPADRGILLKDILENGYTDALKARCLLESDSRPLSTPVKMFHRYKKFTTLVFKSRQHFEDCKKHYDENFKGLPASEIKYDGEIYNGLRYLTKTERERLQTMPVGYCDSLSNNDAACLLGDGWTVDVIAHIFSYIPEFKNK